MYNDWKDKVEKLMRLAEDPATTEAQRQTINEKVMYLMAKFSIDQALFDVASKAEPKIGTIKVRMTNPYALRKDVLLNGIGTTFHCMGVKIGETIIMYGYEDDLEKVAMLYVSLVTQMFTAVEYAQIHKPAGVHGKSFNSSFITAYVGTVLNRIRTAYQRARTESQANTTGTDLVLRNRALAVMHEFESAYPTTKSRKTTVRITNSSAYSQGRQAGMSADIGQTRLSGGRKAIG